MRRRDRLLLALLVVACAIAPLMAVDGPLTNALNLRVRTDTSNGYLLVTAGTYGGSDGPQTNFGNLRLRTDVNGYLLVSGTGLTGTISGVSVAGDVLIGTGGTSFGRVADVASGSVFVSQGVGVAPIWSINPVASNYNTVANGSFTVTGRAALVSTADKLSQVTDNTQATGLEFNSGTPTLTTCGTGAVVAGSHNSAGQGTATGATVCTVTFGVPAFTNTPYCSVTEVTAARALFISSASNAAITISGLTAADVFNWVCIGRIGT